MKRKKNKVSDFYRKRSYLFLALSLIVIIFGAYVSFHKKEEPQIKETVKEKIIEKKEEPQIKETEIKESSILAVPFTVQAPFANWKVHEESCEEAALLMYHDFLLGEKSEDLIQTKVDTELRAMKSWQKIHYGVEPDLTIEKLGVFANEYYGHQYSTTRNGGIDDIKRLISEGKPVLVPVMTHALQNPHYGRENTYHILLIKGYDASGVTTNDAGIKDGKNYYYTWNVLFSAIDAQSKIMSQGRDFLTLSK